MGEKISNDKLRKDLGEVRNFLLHNSRVTNIDVRKLYNSLALTEGKMLRAIFVLIGGSFGSLSKDKLIGIATAVELLHLATLVHDDIIDDSPIRRGTSTLNCSFGIKYGLFMGDYLFSDSYVLFANNASNKGIIEVSNTIKFICEGEINQFFAIDSLSCNVRDYLKRVNGKCACLFSFSLSIGALEGNVDYETLRLLRKVGYYTGMAFQIIDDILDIISSQAALGKPSGNDIAHGIYNLPVILELRNENIYLAEVLKRKDIEKCIEILKYSDGLKNSRLMAMKYTNKAMVTIDKLPDCDGKILLRNIVEKLLFRPY